MTAYKVKLSGCDGETSVQVELTEEWAVFLHNLAAIVNSGVENGGDCGACHPRMYVEKVFVGVRVSGGGSR